MKSNNELGRNRATGHWPGTGSTSFTCNPRKFSEKIALHTQRQAEDTAAFQEVMLDITSTRIQAQRARHARSLAPYGGSLPNVNHLSKSTETQSPDCSFATQQQHLRPDHGKRDLRAGPIGRPNRRHIDSTPYLSFQLSPHSGSSWRRNWSSRSVNEKTQVDQLPVTALSRTNSDSALHTSVRITHIGDTNSAQVLTACSRKSGQPLFLHPVPRIQENIQEEGMFKSQKMASVLPGCDISGKHVLCSPDLSCSFLDMPSLSSSGSLPDLSSLHLPSATSELLDLEPRSHTSSFCSPSSMHHLSTAAHSAAVTSRNFPLPSLSSSLQVFTSNPLLPSSLSNPNLQSTLSCHSLPNSLSSTALSLSLSNSSRQASFSNQSLQSSLSSSSLSNQSVQSATSHCSYSSGIGGSRSCSSSSLSCSPHASGHVTMPHTASSRKRTQLNPLIMPSSGESLWQQPKQFSSNMSQTLSSITQGVPLDTTKVPQETKQLTYCCSQLPPTESPMAYQSLQHHQPEQWDQSRQDTRQKCQQQSLQQLDSQNSVQPQYSQPQQGMLVPPSADSNSQQHLVNPQQYTTQQEIHEQKQNQHHQYQQAQYPQPSLYHPQCLQTQEYVQQQSQPYPLHHHTQSLQLQEKYEEQCWNPQQQLMEPNQYQQQYQYQSQHEGPQYQEQQAPPPSNIITAQDKATCWQNPGNQQNLPNMTVERPRKACVHTKEMPKLQSKMSGYETRKEKTAHHPKAIQSQRNRLQLCGLESVSSLDQECGLHSESYTGLYLTPSQTEALSQKLGQLYKEPLDITRTSDNRFEDVERKNMPDVDHFRHLHTQGHRDEGLQSFPSISITVPSACLDDVISDLPVSVSEFKLAPFAMGE